MGTTGAYDALLPAVPEWLNKGDNAWQMTASTLVSIQSVPGLVILYGSIVKKKWAVNSAFMALYAFAAVLICWVLVCYRMAFGDQLLPFWGKGAPALGQKYLIRQAAVPETGSEPFYPMATLVYFQFTFAAITLILLAGLWGGGFLYQWGVIDYSGGYVIHLSSGIAGLTAAYWVGPRLKSDRERFPPNNVLLMLAGAGLLWMGWSATSLLVWTSLDVIFFKKPSVIGAVQGMMTGLVCITPGAGVVQSWAAIVMGILSGSIPWVSMMILHKNTLCFVLAAAKCLINGGTVGWPPDWTLSRTSALQALKTRKQYEGCILWWEWWQAIHEANRCSPFCNRLEHSNHHTDSSSYKVIPTLRMPDEELVIGDDAVHGEEAYAFGVTERGMTQQSMTQQSKIGTCHRILGK
ncbi:Ammonium transporter 2 member 1 [Vitis vinifera]|uniref:Ammonium transporter 2 member 1 n=1 Tax=Vitis vinifera TaxID=29760 RepID=A0A438FEZ6_VITVI|nr:Ammonium transporter 2 member 1 [Vitis vinifera]